MNKFLAFGFTMLFFGWTGLAQAASTQFTSPNFTVQSVIVGGTGILHLNNALPPQITAGPTVSAITTTSATVAWTTSQNTNSIVEFGTTSGVYTTQLGQVTVYSVLNHSVIVPNLLKGTTYYYRVLSQDVSGNLVESAEQHFATSPGDITPPVIIGTPTIANNSATSVTISWQTDKLSNGVIKYGLHSSTENTVGNPDDQTLFHQVQLNGLLPSQSYFWQLQSKDQSGNVYLSPVQSFTTLTAPTITGVKISDITLNSALVQWQTTIPATTILKYGTTSNYDQVVQDTSTFSTNHLVRIPNLTSGTVYKFRILGSDQSGNGFSSDEYSFETVILPTINDLTLSDITATTAKLTWTSSSDIDQLVHLEIVQSYDPTLVGKKTTVGDEKLVSSHSALLTDLSNKSSYTLSVVGKDQYGNQAISNSLTFTTLEDLDPPIFEDIKTDTTVDLGSRQSVQVLVSISLSKPSTAIIEYGAGASGSYDHKVTTDTGLSANKILIIPGLQPGQSYHFHVIAKSASGIEAISPDNLVLAPAQPLSLTDLIFAQLQLKLGWFSKL